MTAANDKPEWAQSRRERDNARRAAEGLKPRRRWWPWLLLVLAVGGIAAYFVLSPPPPAVEETASAEPAEIIRQLRRSETTTVEPTVLRETVKVTGTLVPARRSDVASQASGRVIAVMVRPGEAVNEGDVLAQIDRAALELQLSQQRATADATRAQLVSSQQQLERTELLANQGNASSSVLEQARSATAALEAQLEALSSGVETAELALANATVKAPLTGIVSSRTVEPGQTIQAGTPLFTIVNLDKMEFDAAASVNSSARVSAGQNAVVTVTGIEGEEFAGQVTRVNPVAMTGTRTVPIYIDLDNSQGSLRGGMFATGHITVMEQDGATAVPAAALRSDSDGLYVLKVVDDRLERQPVERVRLWNRGSLVEVSGLESGDVVVSAPLDELEDGHAIALVEG